MSKKHEPGMAYDMKKLHKVFAFFSLIFLMAVVWVALDDYIRPWKAVQIEAMKIEKSKLAEKIAAEEKTISKEKLSVLEKQLEEARESVKKRSSEIQELNSKLEVVQKDIKEESIISGRLNGDVAALGFKWGGAVSHKAPYADKLLKDLKVKKKLFADSKDRMKDLQSKESKFKQWLFPSVRIRQAGIMPSQLLWLYWPVKLILAILLPLGLLELRGAWSHWAVLAGGSIAGFFAIDYWLRMRRKQRQIRIIHSLSFFVDLLSAYLKSGSPLSQAFEYSARFGFKKDHPLAKEAMLVVAELNAGRNLRKALRAMWRRTGVQDLHRLAGVLEVGAQVGAPIIDTLLQQANVLREKQKEIVIKLISRKSMEMFIPMGLVSVPMFVLLVVFPAGVQIQEAFQMFKLMF